MKKTYVLLILGCLLITGCSITPFSNDDISKNISIIMDNNQSLSNVHFEGYDYYVPSGVKILNKEEYNAEFMDMSNNKYYLYVDIIGYYHDAEFIKLEKTNSYFYEEFDTKENKGYINITKQNNNYYIDFVLNHAKIEAIVKEESLVNAVNNITYILKTITYNDKVLDSLIGENALNYTGETFNLFETKANKEDFLEYIEEYDKYEDTEGILPDEDNVELGESE